MEAGVELFARAVPILHRTLSGDVGKAARRVRLLITILSATVDCIRLLDYSSKEIAMIILHSIVTVRREDIIQDVVLPCIVAEEPTGFLQAFRQAEESDC